MKHAQDPGMALFDLPKAAVLPLLSSLRLVNTAADVLFYDVGTLYRALAAEGDTVVTDASSGQGHSAGLSCMEAIATHIVNLGALADPEGVILVIDTNRAPYVTRYADVTAFLAAEAPDKGRGARAGRKVGTVSVTGVGSSALGSAAFAWNLSAALDAPVAAIVPGFGLADILPQALGGFFGFEVEDWARRTGQQWLDLAAPYLARAGRALALSAPEVPRRREASAAPPFLPGAPESDILHAILLSAPDVVRVVGHSKGALCIENALRDLPPRRAKSIAATTFGCAIAEQTPARYEQILGRIDALGQLNSWGNLPERWIDAWHSTNTLLPLAMPVARLTAEDAAGRTMRA